jgi:hypothetical protein
VTPCRNDCREPALFPRRIFNRPGLDRLDYRIGDYAGIREALMQWLDLAPGLQGWTHRHPDDPGIALLEGAAIIGDILTFYQERYANEAFLRTALWRESIADLVRLVGYRLAPGVGGRGTFAFEVRGGEPVLIPRGFAVSAEVTGREGQSDFETVAAAVAIPALSRFALHRPSNVPSIADGRTQFSVDTAALAAAGVVLEAGDRLMFVVDPADSGTQRMIVVVDSVRAQFERTEFTIRGTWRDGTVAGTACYKLGRSFRRFGHNAPAKKVLVANDGTVTAEDVSYRVMVGLPPDTAEAMPFDYVPLAFVSSTPLDQAVDDLAPGTLFLATLPLGNGRDAPGGDYYREARAYRVHNETLTFGALTGACTVVELTPRLGITDAFPEALTHSDVRYMKLHEVVGARFTVTAVRTPTTTTDLSHLAFFGPPETYAALDNRRVQLARGATVEETLLATDPAAPAAGLTPRTVTLNPPLRAFTLDDFPLDAPTVVAYGNVVDATQGHGEREAVLGNGDSREAFQTFKLPKAPLTYHVSAGAAPPEVPQLEVYVGERKWRREAAFFGHGPLEEIYIVREDADGASWVQFGDGNTGARLPSGLGNVRARYRTGIGAHGALREGTNVQAGGRLDRLDKIRLLGVATGGDEPEDGENARAAAPGKVTSLNRLVSIADHETEALAIAGVWRVAARWSLVDNVPAIVLTILMKTGRGAELGAVRDVLAEQNRCRGAQRFPIVVEAGALEYLYLDASIAIDPAADEAGVIAAIEAALGLAGAETGGLGASRGLFAAGRRRFGEREYATRVEGTLQNVPGVLWAKANALGTLGAAADPATLALPAAPWPFDDVVDCASDRILALDRRHVELRTVATPARTCEP